MNVENLLSRLEKVRPNGRQRWMACCPAHADRTPSLSITEQQNGKVSVKCFAGCSGEEVMGAVGMSLAELYPDWDAHKLYVEHPTYATTKAKREKNKQEEQQRKDEILLEIYKQMARTKQPLTQEDHAKAKAAFLRLKNKKAA